MVGEEGWPGRMKHFASFWNTRKHNQMAEHTDCHGFSVGISLDVSKIRIEHAPT